MFSRKDVVSVILVSLLVWIFFFSVPIIKNMIGESLGYHNCLVCGSTCFLSKERKFYFKTVNRYPFALYELEYFDLCDSCYRRTSDINYPSFYQLLIFRGWGTHDASLIVDKLQRINLEKTPSI